MCVLYGICLFHMKPFPVGTKVIFIASVSFVLFLYFYCIFFPFYRAMHLSAYARSWDRMSSVCLSLLSVCQSVTLVICDHIGWKFRKLIARTISPTPSLLVAERRSIYSQGNIEKFGGDYRWGKEKVACWRTKAAISLKRVKIEEKFTMDGL